MDISIIGRQIAAGRKASGLSQAAFAELLCVTPQAVGKWERSESLPDIFMLAKIGEIIGINDVCYFLGKEPCDCGYCDCCYKGDTMKKSCDNFTTIEQFVEYWESCSLKGLQKIAQKYEVMFNETDTKQELVGKLKKGMYEYCKK